MMGRDPSGLFYIPFTNIQISADQDVDLKWARVELESVAAKVEPVAEYCAAEANQGVNFLLTSAAVIRLRESAERLHESSTNLGNKLQCNAVEGQCNATISFVPGSNDSVPGPRADLERCRRSLVPPRGGNGEEVTTF